MKIGIISLYFQPILPGYGNRIPYTTAHELTKLNHNVFVYTSKIPKKIINENITTNDQNEKSIEIKRLWIPDIDHKNNFNRFIINSIFFLQCFFRILFIKKLDSVMCFVPYLPFFSLVLLPSKIRKIKSFIVQADLWPEVLKELEVVKNDFAYSVISKICFWTFRLSDCIFALTPELKQALVHHKIIPSKIIELEQAVDQSTFKPITQKKRTNEKFQVLYTGSFSPLYDFDIILESAKDLRNKNIEFILLGDGMLRPYLQSKIRKLNLANVKLEPPISDPKKLSKRINLSDVAVVPMKDRLQNNTTCANKIFEYLSCGKPILASAKGSSRNLIVKAGGGLVVDIGDKSSFVKNLLKLYQDPELLRDLGKKGRSYILSNHSMEVYGKKLEEILIEIAKRD